jgi:hypothetical protein
MASGRRLRRKKTINVALVAAGITSSIPVADSANVTNVAFFASGAVDTTFAEGSTTLLSDSVSGGDYVWQLLGYSGETSANSAGFLNSSAIHRYISYAGQVQRSLTDSAPVILYSKDGPKARFNQAYVPTANRVEGTGSIVFSSAISGAAGNLPKLAIYVAGAFPTASTGTSLTILSGSTAIITYTSSSLSDPINTTASFPAAFPFGISGSLPASGDRLSITLPFGYGGLTTSASYTITITGSLSPTASGNNLYIVSGSGGINLTGSTFHSILRQGINGTALSTTSSIGSGFTSLSSYVSASNSAIGVSLFATQNGGTAYSIAVSGSNNKIKKTSGVNYFQFQPYLQYTSFNTASMGTLTVRYSSSADTATLNSWAPGVIVYITGTSV